MADAEMMLAERPGGGGGAGSGGGGAEGPSVGNYKGVMLCNRPFAGPTGLQDPSSGDSKPPLRFGVPDGRRELGVQPSVKVGETRRKPQRNPALVRHRKWLHNLQKERARMLEEMKEKQQEREARLEKFRQKEARVRAAIRAGVDPAEVTKQRIAKQTGKQEGKEADVEAAETKVQETKAEEPEAEEGEEAKAGEDPEQSDGAGSRPAPAEEVEKGKQEPEEGGAADSGAPPAAGPGLSKKQQRKLRKKSKPAWAYTEEAKRKEEEEAEEEELDRLLDFASGLDFDKYVEDYEVRTALVKVQERLEELDQEEKEEREAGEGKEGEGEGEGDAWDSATVASADADLAVRDGLDLGDLEADLDEGNRVGEDEISRQHRLERARREKNRRVRSFLHLKKRRQARRAERERLEQERERLRRLTERGRDEDAESYASARSALSDAKSLRSVHSAKSMAAVMKQVEKRRKGQLSPVAEASEPGGSKVPGAAVREPVVAVLDEEGGQRLRNKNLPSNLPYIRRNPAL